MSKEREDGAAPVALTHEQFAELLQMVGQASGSGVTAETLRTILREVSQISATSMRKALKPENPQAPDISVYSYPEGELAKPRPKLRCDITWGGAPLRDLAHTLTAREIDLLNQIEPGVYRVTRTDGQTVELAVTGTRGATGAWETLTAVFPVTRQDKDFIPPLPVWLYQITHADADPRVSFMEGMQAHLAAALRDAEAKARPLAPAVLAGV